MSEQRREEEAEKMLLMFTTPYVTCGGMRLLEFAAKFGEHETLGVLCRQYGWDATKLPSPASPAVGGEEEAEAYASRSYGRSEVGWSYVRAAYLAGYSRGVEVERENTAFEAEQRQRMQDSYVALGATLEAVEKERDELREGLKEFLDFVAAGATPLTLLASMQRARALLEPAPSPRVEKKEE